MLKELLSIFRAGEPLAEMGENFSRMLELTHEMTIMAGEIYFSELLQADARTAVYKTDIRVNKLERRIRKQVIAHLSVTGNRASVPYCLLLMSLVKDVERIGDYAKNLSEARDYHPSSLPDDQIVQEMREIRREIEFQFSEIGAVFASSDHERAVEFIREGRDVTRRCDAVVGRVARSAYDASTATCVVMGARFYKRIAAHVLNVLSSVVMPLHKLDYYDEKRLAEALPEE
ncbi:MAG: PhoU domain-containing protein [Candidatus Palauibacterales bacterium]|jgi:phosphate transport system protein|nr:PhoU domain-containing protein [Candidatus Palauibacterales bacterium]